jgi:hypothetical protein
MYLAGCPRLRATSKSTKATGRRIAIETGNPYGVEYSSNQKVSIQREGNMFDEKHARRLDEIKWRCER